LFLCFIVLALTPLWVKSQEYVYKNYDVPDGLPSSETYQCLQDSKGYIWCATDNGVSRFDGYKFVNFDAKQGLTHSTVLGLFEDWKGRVWFITLSGNLYYYENSVISAYKHNSVIDKAVIGYHLPIKQAFYVDSLDNVYIGFIGQSIFKISKNGKLGKIEHINNQGFIYIDSIYSGINLNIYVPFKENLIGVIKNDVKFLEIFNNKFNNTSLIFNVEGKNGESFLSFNRSIYQLNNKKITKLITFENDILWFSKDKFNNYWVSIRKHGMQYFSSSNFAGLPNKVFLPGKDVSSVMIDNENAFWFSTLNDGIYYAPTDKIQFLKVSENSAENVLSIGVEPESISLGINTGEIVSYNKTFDKLLKRNEFKHYDLPLKLLYHKQWKSLIIGTLRYAYEMQSMHMKKIVANRNSLDNDYNYDKTVKCLIAGNGEYFYAGTNVGFDKFDRNGHVFLSSELYNFEKIVNALIENYDNSLWIGTSDGLWKLENGICTDWSKKDKLLTYRINAMYKNGNTLYIGTKGAGLVMMDLSTFKIKSISIDDGLSSNYISCITGSNNEVWLGTNRGINKIKFLTQDTYQISRLDVGTGLVNNEINQLALDDSMLYVATKKGFNYIELNHFEWTLEKPKLHLENIKINATDTSLLSNFELSYFQNNIVFTYVAISYKSNRNILYKYRLLPIEKEWQNTIETSINYTTLPPGDYKFMIKARNENGIWSNTNDSITFTIDEPFWKKWWFYLFPISFVVMVIYLLIYGRIEKLKHQNRLRNELNSYMKKAFTLMVNDHFLFNSLNSLNHLILNGEKLESSKMLSRISNYFRSVLFSVKKDFISLSDEINMINLYLEIEKQRLKDKFYYQINIDPAIDLHKLFIPGVVIQPYIESSIWSVMVSEISQVRLDIEIKRENGFLLVSIKTNKKDDPVKPSKNGFKSNFDHLEKVSESIEKRTELINDFYDWNMQVEYTKPIDNSFVDSGITILIKLEMDKLENVKSKSVLNNFRFFTKKTERKNKLINMGAKEIK